MPIRHSLPHSLPRTISWHGTSIRQAREGRTADFAAADNDAVQLVLRDAEGNTYGWLDKSNTAGGYEGKNAAVNWTKTSTKALGETYWQTKFNATAFTDIKVKSSMLYNYNAYETYNVEYSLDGEKWTKVGAIAMPGAKAWTAGEFTLPAEASNKAAVFVRWIADKTSSVKGTTGTNDGIALAQIYITGTAQLFNDGTAPELKSKVPAIGATNASANGKIVLTFDEKSETDRKRQGNPQWSGVDRYRIRQDNHLCLQGVELRYRIYLLRSRSWFSSRLDRQCHPERHHRFRLHHQGEACSNQGSL